jgi:hypothetical protein
MWILRNISHGWFSVPTKRKLSEKDEITETNTPEKRQGTYPQTSSILSSVLPPKRSAPRKGTRKGKERQVQLFDAFSPSFRNPSINTQPEGIVSPVLWKQLNDNIFLSIQQ